VAQAGRVLEAMVASKVQNIVFSSTAAIFGIPEKIPVLENTMQNPINPYGRTKMIGEMLLQDFDDAFGIKFSSLRYFNATGADPDGEIGEMRKIKTHLIPLTLDVALNKRECIEIYGSDYDTPDGTGIRDYVHVYDLGIAHILALEKLKKDNISDFYNLGNGSGHSVKQVLETAKIVSGKEIRFQMAPQRKGDPAKLVADANKAKRELGWQPKYSDLKSQIQHAWLWQMYHGNSMSD